MLKCGLLGEKLGHSYSPQIHGMLGDYEYRLYEKTPAEVEDFLKNGDFDGLNVTIPYKKTVAPLCGELSPQARLLGSVNTIVRRPDGSLYGDNTDYYGFKELMRENGVDPAEKKCLVLGSGGASVTVCAVLRDLGAEEVVVISRSGPDNYENLEKHADASILVNATPVGMYPNNGKSPLDLMVFNSLDAVIDVVYNPALTALLLQAEELGIPYANGLYMLVSQAKRSSELFTGQAIDDELQDDITDTLSAQMQNVVLIGMPGCGKTTIGKLLSEKTGREFLDIDDEVTLRAGKPIPQIFADDGEEVFRRMETEVISDFGKLSGKIIATGGGAVKNRRNYAPLHQNGQIFWIKRRLEDLPKDGRPLSLTTSLEEMYAAREPLYDAFSDFVVFNYKAPEESANAIIEMLKPY